MAAPDHTKPSVLRCIYPYLRPARKQSRSPCTADVALTVFRWLREAELARYLEETSPGTACDKLLGLPQKLAPEASQSRAVRLNALKALVNRTLALKP